MNMYVQIYIHTYVHEYVCTHIHTHIYIIHTTIDRCFRKWNLSSNSMIL